VEIVEITDAATPETGKHDIPYLAGYSKDGKTIYIDRHMPDGVERAVHHQVRDEPLRYCQLPVGRVRMAELERHRGVSRLGRIFGPVRARARVMGS